MKNINTASLDCGIDGVNIKFLSEFETEQELYYFQRSNSNRTIKYGLLKKLGLKNGLVEYSIFINLPQTIRNSNIQPYSFVDCTKYMRVYQMLTEQLNDIFDFDISDLKVTGIECSFSYTLRDNTLLQPMLNYICRAFISKNTPLHVYVKGTQSRRYKKSKIYCDCINVQSFRTSRSSDCLGSYKCYNKLMEELEHATDEKEHNELEQRIANESILRFEWVLNERGVNRVLGKDTVLWSVLSADSINKLMKAYKFQLFATDQFYDRLNRLGKDFRYVLKKDMKLYSPKELVLAHKDICELVRTREYISKRITKVKDAHSYMTIRNQLNAFAQEIGRDNYSYIELENQLKRQIANIVENNNTAIEKLQSEINAMKAIKIEDTPEELTVLEQQAQQKMYEMLIKLKPNDTTGRNKRMLGNWVTHADRATALALTKIMLMPDYEKEFSERYKTILSEKIRKPEQIEHEKAVEPILKEMGTKLGKLFMCSFHLKQAMKSYHN